MAKRTFIDRESGKGDKRAPRGLRRFSILLVLCALAASAVALRVTWATHETGSGEIEGRPSPTFRRICQGGANAGKNCKQNSECPGSTCRDRNVFNITVAVLYNASAGDMTAIQNMISATSAVIFDATDGQAEIGTATIHNNALSSIKADVVIHPSTNSTWWQAQTGHFRTGGFFEVSIDNILASGAPGGPGAHEFSHLVFDPRDEYETRAAGCGAVGVNADCPVPAANDGTCLMDSNGSEYCWGQGNSANTADLTNGNHDPTNVTEQSRCRTNRSCWDQIVWSWPTTFLKPTAAPDPNANGGTVNPTNFVVTNNNVRVVLVLDESGSMSAESPSRIERLKVAAGDFIATAENGTELGLVSFASDAETGSGRANVAIGALGANRSAWTNEVTGLAPSTRTNIGSGLQKARDMITAAGGVTANTYVVLMTDGLNNEPGTPANAAADLQNKINDFMAAGIPVFVTCTGGDLGLQSQCSEIAAGTSGFYSDSADASRMPQVFVDFHERITGHQGVASYRNSFSKIREAPPMPFYVDEFSESASFSLLWDNANASARATLIDPGGNTHQMRPIPQGLYARISKPAVGDWQLKVDHAGGADSSFTASGYVHNRVNNLIGTTRWAKREPGAEMYIYGFPQSRGGAVTEPGAKLTATISRPDGSTDTLELADNGRDPTGHGDDVAGDGIFTGVYKNTNLKGAYGFQISGTIDKWHQGTDAHKRDERLVSPRFMRDLRISTAVGSPGDAPKEPEDDRPGGHPGGPGGETGGWQRYCCWLFWVTLVLLLIALFLLWRCWASKRRRV